MLALLWLCLELTARAGTVEVIGHRGRLEPTQVENSLRQMRRTGAAGFGMEMDLRRSRDGTLYLLHDATLDRSTNGHGAIAERSDAELARLRLRAPDGRTTDEPLPRLDAVVAWAATVPGVTLMLDLKAATAAEVLPLLHRDRLVARTILLTFDRAQAAEALRDGDGARVSVLVNMTSDIADYRRLAAGRPLAFYVPQHASPALFRATHASGIEVISDALPMGHGEPLDARAARSGCGAYAAFVADHPLDVLVTNTPACAASGLAHR